MARSAKIVRPHWHLVKEMVELGRLRLVEKKLATKTVCLYIGYSKNVINATGGTEHTLNYTNSYTELTKAFLKIYDKTTNRKMPIRRIGISFVNVIEEPGVQLNLFVDQEKLEKERKLESAIVEIKSKLGKNSVLRGMNLEEDANTIMRNKLIGGHNSG